MCGPLSLARGRGPFSFIWTPSGLFWSLVFRVRTILSASGPFLLLAYHTWTVFYQTYGPLPAACGRFSFSRAVYMLCVDLFPLLADRFHSSGPRVDFSGHSRSRADHSLRGRTFFYCLRGTRGQYLNRLEICPPRADLFRSRGPFICYVWTSVTRSRTVFIHQDLEWTFLVTHARMRTILSASGPFLLLAWHTRTIF